MSDIQIQYPWALGLLLVIPAVFVVRRKSAASTGFSAISILRGSLAPGVFKRYVLDVLAGSFMVSAVLAVANIQYSSFWQKTHLETKWIMIVQDLSGSMNRLADEAGRLTLGDIALEGIRAFIDMRHEDDLIGLIAFSSYAKLISPPTFDKAILKQRLNLLNRDSDSIVFRELTLGGATNASYAAWLALCGFFMLLPREHQPTFEELTDFRYSLLGRTLKEVPVPQKLKNIHFGHGMAIVLFTDGRIQANRSDEDVQKGLPNFINVVKLINKFGIRIYLIVVGGDVDESVRQAVQDLQGGQGVGRIFYMPRRFDPEKIRAVYSQINDIEKNRLLVTITEKKRETRQVFGYAAMVLLIAHSFLRLTPWLRRM